MFKGAVNFVAKIRGNGMRFPSFDFNPPNEPGVHKIEIEGPNGDEIRSTVHLASVATQDDGRALATKVNTAALNRIAFFHSMAIEKAQSSGDQFSPVSPQPGIHAIAVSLNCSTPTLAARVVVGIPTTLLKAQLEQASPSGERNFGLFRSARQSESPVEEFMHLYNMLLMIYNDGQVYVDTFIVDEDPAVQQTQRPPKQRPRKASGVKETVYTRLRNELAHNRPDVNPDKTKAEMANRLGGLIALTKRAIELYP